jgi:hypothetical protein
MAYFPQALKIERLESGRLDIPAEAEIWEESSASWQESARRAY